MSAIEPCGSAQCHIIDRGRIVTMSAPAPDADAQVWADVTEADLRSLMEDAADAYASGDPAELIARCADPDLNDWFMLFFTPAQVLIAAVTHMGRMLDPTLNDRQALLLGLDVTRDGHAQVDDLIRDGLHAYADAEAARGADGLFRATQIRWGLTCALEVIWTLLDHLLDDDKGVSAVRRPLIAHLIGAYALVLTALTSIAIGKKDDVQADAETAGFPVNGPPPKPPTERLARVTCVLTAAPPCGGGRDGEHHRTHLIAV